MKSHERGFRRAAASSGASGCLNPSRVGLHVQLARRPCGYPHPSVCVSRRCQGISRLALLVGTASEPSRASASAGCLRPVLKRLTSCAGFVATRIAVAAAAELFPPSYGHGILLAQTCRVSTAQRPWRNLTPRSRRPATAGVSWPLQGPGPVFLPRPSHACRSGRLSSNVRLRKQPVKCGRDGRE
jgi:hypothetical protein